jgi:type IV secretion system protein VirB4
MAAVRCMNVRDSRADTSLPTWRKLDGVMCLCTQSPHKVIESPISRSVIEQTPTKIYLPNSEATREDYVDGFNLRPP